MLHRPKWAIWHLTVASEKDAQTGGDDSMMSLTVTVCLCAAFCIAARSWWMTASRRAAPIGRLMLVRGARRPPKGQPIYARFDAIPWACRPGGGACPLQPSRATVSALGG